MPVTVPTTSRPFKVAGLLAWIGLLWLAPVGTQAATAQAAGGRDAATQAAAAQTAGTQTAGAPAAGAQATPSLAGAVAHPVCAAPAPGRASCLALRLGTTPDNSPSTQALSPEDLHIAYRLPTTVAATEPQTIALVDAYDDPHAEADLEVFDRHYGLLECTHADGCFTKINQAGQEGQGAMPQTSGEWSIEISTDIEVAHAVCQNCHILLVEAATDLFTGLDAAEETAAARIEAASKQGEISNSWGGPEPAVDLSAFDHPGIVITASAGDAGYLNWEEAGKSEEEGYFDGPDYPASSPNVVAVGGTSLSLSKQHEWAGESVWNDEDGAGGGGCSARFNAPHWQLLASGWASVGCGSERAVADVSADADPNTGVAVYDSVPEPEGKAGEAAPEWTQIGGTSVASPIVASAFALAGGAHGVPYPAATLYAHADSAALHDVVTGGNGECDGVYAGSCSGSLASPLDCGAFNTICNAGPGYDGPTGVGTPDGLTAFVPVAGEVGGGTEGGSGHKEGGQEGGSTGGGTTTSGSGGGAGSGPGTGSGGSGSGSGGPVATPGTSAKPATGGAVLLTHLSLTLSAVAALNSGRAPLSRVAFTFTLSAAARVRVTLARRVRVHGHWVWSTLPGANSLSARAGVDRAHLSGRGALPSGFYRLTLTPAHGAARSLAISIG
jgi:hypothetical protein